VGWFRERLTDGASATFFATTAQCAVKFETAARTSSQAFTSKKNRTYEIATSARLGRSYEASASTFAVFASDLVSSRHV